MLSERRRSGAILLALGTLRCLLVLSPVLRRTNKEKSQWQCSMARSRSFPAKNKEAGTSLAACMGERNKGFNALQARSGVTRETWSLQETSMGSFMLVWFEAPDIEKAFTDLATADDEFSTWFRGQVKDVTGVDLGAPPESPPPDVLVNWTAEERPPL